MARQKQSKPLPRVPSNAADGFGDSSKQAGISGSNGAVPKSQASLANGKVKPSLFEESAGQAGLTQLVICVGGIYVSFLTWALLQERITTTTYHPPTSPHPERWTYPIFLNTIQSTFAALSGYLYLLISTRSSPSGPPPIFPSRAILFPLLLVSITSSLASPFGYAALAHIDYITFILAKSCKLLPVMFLHLTIFRKSYPLYKYLVVALVTMGVAVFTLYHPSSAKKASKGVEGSSLWGLSLLGINLLFDGLTNSTQDHIFGSHRAYSAPQMMVAQNVLSTLLTALYLLLSPYLAQTPLLAFIPEDNTTEFASALAFLYRNPGVLKDVLGFAACGAVGQIFIYYTLSKFSSLLLVTVTVTRKMLTMMLSVLWFGHRLTGMQWVGVGLVFGGVGAEGWIQRREKMAKERARREGKKIR